jgi:hypothetical protein
MIRAQVAKKGVFLHVQFIFQQIMMCFSTPDPKGHVRHCVILFLSSLSVSFYILIF